MESHRVGATPTRAFITGASSGLGAALARELAKPGVVLGLSARRADRLAQTAHECEARGAKVFCYTLDVVDASRCECVATEFIADAGGIDLVIANAGVAGWQQPEHFDARGLNEIMRVNFCGAINSVIPFVPKLIEQKHGHIVAISSIAGLRPYPGGTYSASKVALRYYMEGLRLDLKKYGIEVTTVAPGFIESEMVDLEKGDYLFLMNAEEAARETLRAVRARKRLHIFPWQWRVLRFIMPFLPGFVVLDVVRKTPNPPSK